jgi:hypothetical protein
MVYDYPIDKLFAYGEMLDAFCKPRAAGSISKNNMFWVEQPTGEELLMCTKLQIEALMEMPSMAVKTSGPVGSATRKQALKDYKLKVLDVPGIKDIKQVELYTKCRPFVETLYNESMLPRPKYEVLLRQKAVKVEKAKVARYKKQNHEEEEGNKKPAAKKMAAPKEKATVAPKEKATVAPNKKVTEQRQVKQLQNPNGEGLKGQRINKKTQKLNY